MQNRTVKKSHRLVPVVFYNRNQHHMSFRNKFINPVAGVFFFIEEEVCVFFFVRTYRLAGIFHNPIQSRAKLRFILCELSKALFKRNIKLPLIVHACIELLEIGHEIYNRTVEIYKIKNK